MKIPDWTKYVFWDSLPDGYRLPKPLPGRDRGLQHVHQPRPAARARSPTRRSSRSTRRSHPDTKKGYLFFVAKADGSGSSAFAKTHAEHDKNVAEVRQELTWAGRRPAGCPRPPTSRPRPTRRPAALDRGRPRPLGPSGWRRLRERHGRRADRRLLRDAPRAHALADRVHARRGRGEGRRPLGPVPRRAGRGGPLADSRYTIQARREAPDARRRRDRLRLPRRVAGRWSRRRRAARRASRRRSCRTPCGSGSRPRRPTSSSSRSTAGSRRCARSRSPTELERVAAACAVADRALATLLPEIRPGVTEHELALRLEWLIRTGGAEALAFDVACLVGSRGGAAARRARRPAGPRRRGPPVRLRRAGRGLPQRHDPDAVRRRADASATSRSTSSSRGPSRRPSTRSRRGVGRRAAAPGGRDST